MQKSENFVIIRAKNNQDSEKEAARMKLFEYANHYCKETTWKELSLLKACLCAIGVMLGLSVPQNKRKPVLLAAAALFGVTYPMLMTGFLQSVLRQREQEQ